MRLCLTEEDLDFHWCSGSPTGLPALKYKPCSPECPSHFPKIVHQGKNTSPSLYSSERRQKDSELAKVPVEPRFPECSDSSP